MIILNFSYSVAATGQLGYVQEQDPGYGQHIGYEQQLWGHDQQTDGYEGNSVEIRDNCAMGLAYKLSFIHTQFVEISRSCVLYQSRMAMLDQDVLQSNMTLALLEFSGGKYFTKKYEVGW